MDTMIVSETETSKLRRALAETSRLLQKELAGYKEGHGEEIQARLRANLTLYQGYVVGTRGVWAEADLKNAFDDVADKTNWKMPIKMAIVRNTRLNITLDAIEHYAGGRAVSEERNPHTAYVSAPGYYAVIGA